MEIVTTLTPLTSEVVSELGCRVYTVIHRLSQLKLDDTLYGKVARSLGILLKRVCSVVHYEMIEYETVSLAHFVVENELKM